MRRIARAWIAFVAVSSAALVAPVSGEAAAPGVGLEAASPVVALDGWDGSYWLGDIGVYLTNRGTAPLEVQVQRSAYGRPIEAYLVKHDDDHHLVRTPLAAGVVDGFAGFTRLGQITVTDASGAIVAQQNLGTCFGWNTQRLSPDAPGAFRYPAMCGGANPFTLGSVWGIDQGWGVSVDTGSGTFIGSTGVYHARVTLDPATADALQIAPDARVVDVELDGTMQMTPPPPGPKLRAHAAGKGHRLPRGLRRYTHEAGAARPAVASLPDLIALPAWGMSTSNDLGRDYLNFGANVWNAGPERLSVEGFRRPGTDIMDAFQYLYRNGRQVGYARTGTFLFDRRVGHNHWHFQDFAQYDLLDASARVVAASEKQSFCIAPTDGIDLLRPGASWFPGNGDLGSACGWVSALWIREAMPVGWGDTYYQSKGGQAFDITDLPNGSYQVRVMANPNGSLFERTTANNTSLRLVILAGDPGARTVTVPPYLGIDTDPTTATK